MHHISDSLSATEVRFLTSPSQCGLGRCRPRQFHPVVDGDLKDCVQRRWLRSLSLPDSSSDTDGQKVSVQSISTQVRTVRSTAQVGVQNEPSGSKRSDPDVI